MVTCACGKTIDKVPSWLEGVTVAFVCNNCPNRTIKGITEISLASTAVAKENETGALDEGFAAEEDDEAEED